MLKGKEARDFCLCVRSAAVLFACFLFLLALFSGTRQGSAQRQTFGQWPKSGGEEKVSGSTKTEKEKLVSKLRGLGTRRNGSDV